jgi:glycosyltransferase involved in cell wall biosynthesis
MDKKKRVAIVSSQYFWLPEEAGPTRFFTIASVLKDAGFEIDVITSSFEHHDKKQRDKTLKSPFNMIYIDTPPYKRNFGPMRVVSNQIFTSKLKKYLHQNGKQFSAIYCSLPPNDIAAVAGEYCHKNQIPFIVDVEDLWPEAMEMVVHNSILQKLIFPKFHNDAEKAYQYADAVVGTSEDYTERACLNNHRNIPMETVYVGCDIDKFDKGVGEFYDTINKGSDDFWVTYAGSIGTSYDIKTFVLSGKKLMEKYPNIKLKILGGGPFKDELETLSQTEHITNVEFLGYVQYPKMAAYLTKSDVVLNSFIKGAPQSIVNKVGDYLSSGRPMINTLENPVFCNLVERNKVGINIEPENVDILAQAIIDMYQNSTLRKELGQNARDLAEKRFDRKTSYQEIVRIVKKFVN